MSSGRKRKAKTERLSVTLALPTLSYLADLAQVGIHGTSVTDVAKSLIEQGIRDAIKQNFLKPKASSDGTS